MEIRVNDYYAERNKEIEKESKSGHIVNVVDPELPLFFIFFKPSCICSFGEDLHCRTRPYACTRRTTGPLHSSLPSPYLPLPDSLDFLHRCSSPFSLMVISRRVHDVIVFRLPGHAPHGGPNHSPRRVGRDGYARPTILMQPPPQKKTTKNNNNNNNNKTNTSFREKKTQQDKRRLGTRNTKVLLALGARR